MLANSLYERISKFNAWRGIERLGDEFMIGKR
jgi:hypothetical protein